MSRMSLYTATVGGSLGMLGPIYRSNLGSWRTLFLLDRSQRL
jgi:hypothetical protein